MAQFSQLFENNKKWAENIQHSNPDFFTNLAKGQQPNFLWIGCSDSRVPAAQVCGLGPGDMFVHRNIANVVNATDMSLMSVLQYAVEVLGVKDILVCGHYGCGGVAGALGHQSLGLIDGWLKSIKDIFLQHKNEVDKFPSGSAEQVNHMVEVNVKAQVLNLCSTNIVQKAWDKGHPLTVHGLVFDLGTGLLKNLEVSIQSKDQLPNTHQYQ